MSVAGQQLVAGRIPGERIATTVETASSAGFTTTETVVVSVTASVVNGRIYRVLCVTGFDSTVVDDSVFLRLREDSVTGTVMQGRRHVIDTIAGSTGIDMQIEVEFTAAATANKTFVATAVRDSGTGTINMAAGATFPTYLYVDFIR